MKKNKKFSAGKKAHLVTKVQHLTGMGLTKTAALATVGISYNNFTNWKKKFPSEETEGRSTTESVRSPEYTSSSGSRPSSIEGPRPLHVSIDNGNGDIITIDTDLHSLHITANTTSPHRLAHLISSLLSSTSPS